MDRLGVVGCAKTILGVGDNETIGGECRGTDQVLFIVSSVPLALSRGLICDRCLMPAQSVYANSRGR